MKLALFVTVIAMLGLTECTPSTADRRARYARLSSGATGCSPDQILIRDDEGEGMPLIWTAYCNDKRYQCSAGAVGPATCSPYQGK